MATLPIGIQTRSLRRPLRRALETAAELGAEGVEIDVRNELRIADFSQTALRQFRRVLEDLRLKVFAVAYPTRRPIDDPDDLERRLLATREAMTFAYKLGARVVIGRVGSIEDAEEAGPTPSQAEALTILGAHGEHTGARFAFASAATPEAQCALIDQAGRGVVGAALHPPLLIGAGHDPTEAAATLGDRVLHVHAVDAVREPTVSDGGATEVQLGRGEADLPTLLATLDERGYQGPLTLERHNASDPVASLSDAIAYLRTM
ncbi:Xylose isomerase-like TIM barrel [Planctomycetes bacterium MalM25]|nr:Xylose isomerase-like TIM barrel [Planctomycetes bacterium MalM25]